MDMELSTGEFSDHSQILRGKRSKRKRPSTSPPFNYAPAVTSSYSSGGAGDGSGGNYFSTQYSPATSTDVSATTEEELEEMANCLIMLAESLSNKSNHHHRDYSEKVISRRLTDTATAGKSGYSCLYECKTCNRTFPSFQALGGHRASHTKPNKVVSVSPPEEIETKALILPKSLTEKVNERTEQAKVNTTSTVQLPPLSFLTGSGNSRASGKVHECSICRAEFSSGQALGGHMRRHRITPAPINTKTTKAIMSPSSPLSPMMVTNSGDQTETSEENGGGRREMMLLDLNLPAPEYDQEEDTFQFMSSTQAQQLVFTSQSMINYQY